MPRKARLDVPELVHHVMARGIDGRDIFLTDADKHSFLQRLSDAITHLGKARLYAWALMSNHFHLLIRPEGEVRLSNLMQRLMTGYAVNFNKIHGRKGHLFQNRFKSIIVEEEAYFLELIRYIHLNPVRAGIVNSIIQLGNYKFTGHAVLLGKREFPIQNKDDVLLRFSEHRSSAMKQYLDFVAAGFDQKVREELRGGGLIRSCGGVTAVLARTSQEREAADDRILGLGEFVECVLKDDQKLPSKKADLEDILIDVVQRQGVTKEEILGQGKERTVSKARRQFFLRAQREGGVSVAFLARMTGRAHVSVARAIVVAKMEAIGDKS